MAIRVRDAILFGGRGGTIEFSSKIIKMKKLKQPRYCGHCGSHLALLLGIRRACKRRHARQACDMVIRVGDAKLSGGLRAASAFSRQMVQGFDKLDQYMELPFYRCGHSGSHLRNIAARPPFPSQRITSLPFFDVYGFASRGETNGVFVLSPEI